MKKIVFISLLLIFGSLLAQNDAGLKKELNTSKSGLAVQGYDVVSYFSGTPTKGKSEFRLKFKEAVYYFSNEANKQKFKLNPSKYAPQYGGWCAYAMGDDGSKVAINPKTFKIINDELYLFYNKFGINTLNSWNKDEVNLKIGADEYWLLD